MSSTYQRRKYLSAKYLLNYIVTELRLSCVINKRPFCLVSDMNYISSFQYIYDHHHHHHHHQISTTIDVIIIIITAIIVTIIILAALELNGLIGLEANSRSGPLHSIPCLVLIVFAVLFLCLPMSCFVSCAHNLPTVCSCT